MHTEHQMFCQMLEQELTVAKSLHLILQDELVSLQNRDLQALGQINQEKIKQLQALQSYSQIRCEWMLERHIELNPKCLQHPLICHEDSNKQQHLEKLWQQLADQFSQNSELTEVLAEVVLQAKQRTHILLNLLKGQNNQKSLYNKQGQEKSQLGLNGFISA